MFCPLLLVMWLRFNLLHFKIDYYKLLIQFSLLKVVFIFFFFLYHLDSLGFLFSKLSCLIIIYHTSSLHYNFIIVLYRAGTLFFSFNFIRSIPFLVIFVCIFSSSCYRIRLRFVSFPAEGGASHCVWYCGIAVVYIICGWPVLPFGIPGTAAVWTPQATFGCGTMR